MLFVWMVNPSSVNSVCGQTYTIRHRRRISLFRLCNPALVISQVDNMTTRCTMRPLQMVQMQQHISFLISQIKQVTPLFRSLRCCIACKALTVNYKMISAAFSLTALCQRTTSCGPFTSGKKQAKRFSFSSRAPYFKVCLLG